MSLTLQCGCLTTGSPGKFKQFFFFFFLFHPLPLVQLFWGNEIFRHNFKFWRDVMAQTPFPSGGRGCLFPVGKNSLGSYVIQEHTVPRECPECPYSVQRVLDSLLFGSLKKRGRVYEREKWVIIDKTEYRYSLMTESCWESYSDLYIPTKSHKRMKFVFFFF